MNSRFLLAMIMIERVPTYLLFAWRIVLLLVLGVPYFLLSLCLDFIGLFVVPLAIWFGINTKSPINGSDIFTAPTWLWLWGNDEEGYDSPNSWAMLPDIKGRFRHMYMWAAIRNGTGNQRFIRWLNPPQRARDVQWITLGRYTVVWQGLLTRFIWNDFNREHHTGAWFSFGWKYEPEASDSEGWQAHGIGFAARWVRQ